MKRIYFNTRKEAMGERQLMKKTNKFSWRIYYDAFKEKYYLIKYKKKSFWDNIKWFRK